MSKNQQLHQSPPLPSPSFSNLYNTAQNLLQSSLQTLSVHPSSSALHPRSFTFLLSQPQISQYNLIEMLTFDLNKDIRSKYTSLGRGEIMTVLIHVQEIVGELEKLCAGLEVGFLYELFEKVVVCLTMVATLGYDIGAGEILDKAKDGKQDEKGVEIISKTLKPSITNNNNKPVQKQSENPLPKQKNTTKNQKRITNKLAGVSLYNENYRRYIENRQLLMSLNQAIKDNGERKQFWKDLNQEYKVTIGLCGKDECQRQQQKQKEEAQKNAQNIRQFKQFSIHLKNKSQTPTNPTKTPNSTTATLSPQACHSKNAINILCNYRFFAQEAQSFDYSGEGFKKTLQEIISTYQNQKYMTLDGIKKIIEKFWALHEDQAKKLDAIVKSYKEKCDILQEKLSGKLLKLRDTSVQTIPCQRISRLQTQCQRLTLEVKRLECMVQDYQQTIQKKNLEFANLEKKFIEFRMRLQLKEKKCVQYEHKTQNLEKTQAKLREIWQLEKEKQKNEIESHCTTFRQNDDQDLEEQDNHTSKSKTQNKSGDTGSFNIRQIDYNTQKLINSKISDQLSIKGKVSRQGNGRRNITFFEPQNLQSSLNTVTYRTTHIGPTKQTQTSQNIFQLAQPSMKSNSIAQDIIKQDTLQNLPSRKTRKIIKFTASKAKIQYDSDSQLGDIENKQVNGHSLDKSVSIFGDQKRDGSEFSSCQQEKFRQKRKIGLKLCYRELQYFWNNSGVNFATNSKVKFKKQAVFNKSSISSFYNGSSRVTPNRKSRERQRQMTEQRKNIKKSRDNSLQQKPAQEQNKRLYNVDGATFQKWDFGQENQSKMFNESFLRRTEKKTRTFNFSNPIHNNEIAEVQEEQRTSRAEPQKMETYALGRRQKPRSFQSLGGQPMQITENKYHMQKKLKKISNTNARKYPSPFPTSFSTPIETPSHTTSLHQTPKTSIITPTLTPTQTQSPTTKQHPYRNTVYNYVKNRSANEFNCTMPIRSQAYLINYEASTNAKKNTKKVNRRFLNPNKITVQLSDEKQ